MRRVVMVVLSLLLLSLAVTVYAQDKPTLTTPTEGQLLGPNYDLLGSMPHKAFLIVLTDVVRTDTNEVIHTVPGIRHWTNADGTFHFRVASPRVAIGEKGMPLLYRVRVFESDKSGNNGPETVVNCGMAQ